MFCIKKVGNVQTNNNQYLILMTQTAVYFFYRARNGMYTLTNLPKNIHISRKPQVPHLPTSLMVKSQLWTILAGEGAVLPQWQDWQYSPPV